MSGAPGYACHKQSPLGLAITLPPGLEYFHQKDSCWRRIHWGCALLALIPPGLIDYLYLNYYYLETLPSR